MNKLLHKLLGELGADGSDLPGPALQEEPAPVDDGGKWASFMDGDDDTGEEFAEEPVEPPATPEPAPAPAAPEESAPVAAEPQLQPPAPAPVVPQATPEELAEARKVYEASVAARYTMSEEQALQLQTEPEKVLPQLAARVYVDVMQDVTQQIMGVMPQVIQGYVANTTRETQAQSEFFGAWPELKGHDQQVLTMGAMFRQLNPTATPQEAIAKIGEMTMAALGLKRQQQVAPAAPAAPQQFRPAAPGHVQTPVPTKNKWEAVMDDD